MKLSTATINTIELTSEEEALLWSTHPNCREVCGKKVKIWNTSDGNNEMLLDLEQSFRRIIIVPSDEKKIIRNKYKEIFNIFDKKNIHNILSEYTFDKKKFYDSDLKNNRRP
jgi:hypothetical protein